MSKKRARLRLVGKRAETAEPDLEFLLVSNQRETETFVRETLGGVATIEIVTTAGEARGVLESKRWIGVLVDLKHCGGDGFKVFFQARALANGAIALLDDVDVKAITRISVAGDMCVKENYGAVLEFWAERVVKDAIERGWLRGERAGQTLATLVAMRHRRNDNEMAMRIGIRPEDLSWADRLRACDWRGMSEGLRKEILSLGQRAAPTLLSMFDEPGIHRELAAEIIFDMGARSVIRPLVKSILEAGKGAITSGPPSEVIKRMPELGRIVAKPLLAGLAKATPLGRFHASRILTKLGVRDERIFQLLCDLFQDPDDFTHIASAFAEYGDERAIPVLLARIETFDWKRDAEWKGKAGVLREFVEALYALGGRLTKDLRERALQQYIDDQVPRALSRALPDGPARDERLDLMDQDPNARHAFAERFAWWARPILRRSPDPRMDRDLVWDLGVLWSSAFHLKGDSEEDPDDIADDLLRRHRAMFADYYPLCRGG